jgi:hypothetical protein
MDFWKWYISLFTSPDDKIILAAITTTLAVITFILNFVLKWLFKSDLVVNLLKYFVGVIWRNRIVTIIALLVISASNYFTDYRYLGAFLSVKFILFTLSILTGTLVTVSIISKSRRKLAPLNIAVYGCFSINKNEKFTIDISAEHLNQKMFQTLQYVVKNTFTYSNDLLSVYFVRNSKLIPILFGYNGLNNRIAQKIISQKHLATIHFTENVNTKTIHPSIQVDNIRISDSEPNERVIDLITSICAHTYLTKEQKIDCSLKIFLMQFCTSYMDILLDQKDYKTAHYALDDSVVVSTKEI